MNRFYLFFLCVLFACGSSKNSTETKVKELKMQKDLLFHQYAPAANQKHIEKKIF